MGALATYRTRLAARRTVAEATVEFTLERPEGFEFRAGQWIDLRLPAPAEQDPRGASRTFSLASPPSAPQLTVASRMRDTPFKHSLHALALGAALELDGPSGSFLSAAEGVRPVAMLAGGIGVTPFLSLIRDRLGRGDTRPLWLFGSNRRPPDAPYLEELSAAAARQPSFRFTPTITRPSSSFPWSGSVGPITRKLLHRHLPRGSRPLYFVAGPVGFVEAMREMLDGHAGPDAVTTEVFLGY